MSNTDELAELGLGLDTDVVENQTAVDETAVSESTETEAQKKTRKAVVIGSVTASDEAEDLPDIEGRGAGFGTRESKYDFSDIGQPVSKGVIDGVEKFSYFSKLYTPGEGTEVDALDLSVKSAASQANKKARDNNTPERFITRAVITDGVHTGTKVFRVDNTTGIDDKKTK